MATCKHREAPSLFSLRQEARTIYGSDVQGYDAGRPDYPAEVYEILTSRCGLRAGASVVEIGPGTGLVTRRLVAAGARVVAVEPDQHVAAHLAAAVSSDVEIIPGHSSRLRSRRTGSISPWRPPRSTGLIRRPGYQSSAGSYGRAGGWRCGGRSSTTPTGPTHSGTQLPACSATRIRATRGGVRRSSSIRRSVAVTWNTWVVSNMCAAS